MLAEKAAAASVYVLVLVYCYHFVTAMENSVKEGESAVSATF